ncbi:hypothetical protein SGLAM104S_00808 [Streptomyces glaucescens]
MRAGLTGSVAETEDWPLLAAVGLGHPHSRSFLLDLPAPATDRARAYVAATLSRVRDSLGDHLDADDRATLDRLLDPDDKASVHPAAGRVRPGRAHRAHGDEVPVRRLRDPDGSRPARASADRRPGGRPKKCAPRPARSRGALAVTVPRRVRPCRIRRGRDRSAGPRSAR